MGFRGTRRRTAVVFLAATASIAAVASANAADPPKKKKPHSTPPAATAPASTSPPSSGAAGAGKSRAADLYKKAVDAYMHGDFAQAITLLDEAYSLDPQPVLVYNQARAHEGLGHTDEAITLYEKYLQQEPSSPDRGAIEQRLSTLKKQKEDKERLDKEKADVEAQRAQQQEQQQALEQREREAAKPVPKKRSVFPYVVAGVGVAGLATGTVFGFMAKSKEDSGNSAANLRDATEAQDTGKTYATVSNVSFIVGGVLLAGGVVWWLIDGGILGGSKKTGSAHPVFLGGTF